MVASDQEIHNEFLLEIRYKPNARILDHRGDWAERISEHMRLPRWRAHRAGGRHDPSSQSSP